MTVKNKEEPEPAPNAAAAPPKTKKKKKKRSSSQPPVSRKGSGADTPDGSQQRRKRSSSKPPVRRKGSNATATATATATTNPDGSQQKRKRSASQGQLKSKSNSNSNSNSNASTPSVAASAAASSRSNNSNNNHNNHNNTGRPKPNRRNTGATGATSTTRSVVSSATSNKGKRPPPNDPTRKIRPPRTIVSTNNSNSNNHNNNNHKSINSERTEGSVDRPEWHPPSRLLILLWTVVGAELIMDLVTTIISFRNFMTGVYCCKQPIDLGHLPLGVTIPFFLIVVIEVALLAHSVRLSLYARRQGTQLSQQGFKADDDKFLVLPGMEDQNGTIWLSFINVLVLLNPFFGSLVAWMLLYQSSENECFAVLGLEAASLFLHWFSVYLEGRKLSWCSIALHAVPILPFFITVVVVLVYLQEGGVCYLVQDTLFWYEGCQVCEDGTLPDKTTNKCLDGTRGLQADYCGEDKQFCFFPYA